MLLNAAKVLRNLKVAGLIFALFAFNRNAEAAHFDDCDIIYNLKAGSSFVIKSGIYSSCRYKLLAPLDHNIVVNCTINLDRSCGTESFYIERDGDKNLTEPEQVCGYGTFQRKSLFRSMVLAYISHSPGKYRCRLRAKPQACDCGWSVNTKISNGQEASMNEIPSIAALMPKVNNISGILLPQFCSAVIISHKYLITAAHCLWHQPDPAFIEAWVGRHNISSPTDTKYAASYDIRRIIKHPDYNRKSLENDIALLETVKDIEYSRGVGPICLPSAANANNDFIYQDVEISGWGCTHFGGPLSSTLQKATVFITDNKVCANEFKDSMTVHESHLCTLDIFESGKDTCQFDSGGPITLVMNNRQLLVGLVSYGNACGRTFPAVNTRITSYLKWIYQNTRYSTCNSTMLW